SGMRLRQWCIMGLTVLLLLCEIAVSQLCKSLITMVDGFHTLFILFHMVLHQTEGFVKPCTAPSCGLSFPDSRKRAVGVFISHLLLVSLCVAYFLEIMGFMVKPHPVHHPLLPVVVGAGSLLHKMLLFVLDWDELLDKKAGSCRRRAETQPPLEMNHNVCHRHLTTTFLYSAFINVFASVALRSSSHNQERSNNYVANIKETLLFCTAEESQGQDEEELSVPSKVQTAAHHCLHSGALVLCNPGTPNLPQHDCRTELQGLFTSLLALINSLVTLVVPRLLHGSGACSVLVYLDPGLSMLAVITLIATSVPQVYRYGMLLLQVSPPHMRVSDVGRRLAGVPGVQDVHELHVWQLTESLTVASVHVHCHAGFTSNSYADVMSGVTKVLQNEGVSCSTIQPEFTSSSSAIRGDEECSLACGKACAASMCC
uniref:Cation efflux protein cytoplasmic domain-containing protein n=1 Tax=Poecilia formosa TaxID=48698 RepID=A0A087XUG8_POEFO